MVKFIHKKSWYLFGLALVLFVGLTLQTPLMSYAMEGMDCDTTVMCAACGCIANPVSSPLSSYFIEMNPLADLQAPKPIRVQEQHFHPPR